MKSFKSHKALQSLGSLCFHRRNNNVHSRAADSRRFVCSSVLVPPHYNRKSMYTDFFASNVNVPVASAAASACALQSSSRRTFSSSHTVKLPSLGDSITEGTLNEWKKQPGDYVKQDEVVAIIDTDKVSVDINSPANGVIEVHLANPGDTLLVGSNLFTMQVGAEASAAKSSETNPASQTPPQPQTSPQPQPQPQSIKEPVQTTAAKPAPAAASEKKSVPAATAGPGSVNLLSFERTEERVPMSRLRKRIAERLKSAQNTAASLTTFQEADMSSIMAMRSELNAEFIETHKIKFGFVSAFLFSSAQALLKMPQMNAFISESGDEVIYKNYVDISVAVATPTGLLVPVIRDCQRKSMAELEIDLVDVARRAREGKIALEEMAGGTFSISNGGVFGSLLGTPILNPPQSSILGLHSIKDRPVAKDGEIVIRPMMYLALTYDHRLIDGREAVLFLNRIKDGIEDPRRLLLRI